MKKLSKRLISLLLVVLMLSAMSLPMLAADEALPTYADRAELEAPKAITKPTIDGTKDASYGSAYDINNNSDNPATAKASFAWDEDYLYMYIEVTDAGISNSNTNGWDNDRIRWYLDLANEQTEYDPSIGTDAKKVAGYNNAKPNYMVDLYPYAITETAMVGTVADNFENGLKFNDAARLSDGKTPFKKGGSSGWASAYRPYISYSIKALNGESLDSCAGYIMEIAVPSTEYVVKKNEWTARDSSVETVSFTVGQVIGMDVEVRDQGTNQTSNIKKTATEFDSAYQNLEGNPRAYGANLKLVKSNTPCDTHSADLFYTDNGDGTHSEACPICFNTVSASTEPHSGGKATCTQKAKCAKCGAFHGDDVSHTYTAKIPSSKYLKEGSEYYFACITCGEKGSDTYTSTVTVPSADAKLEMSASRADVVVDGTADDGYGPEYNINAGLASNTNGVGAVGTVRFAWDENFIYSYIVVYDDTPTEGGVWNRDMITMYMDLNNAQTDYANDTNAKLNGANPYYKVMLASFYKDADENVKENITQGTSGYFKDAAATDGIYNIEHYNPDPDIMNDKSGNYKCYKPFALGDLSRNGATTAVVSDSGSKIWAWQYGDYIKYSAKPIGGADSYNDSIGYIMEIATPRRSYIAELNSWTDAQPQVFAEGSKIGMDIVINDNKSGTSYQACLNNIARELSAEAQKYDNNPAALGATLTLSAANEPCSECDAENAEYIDNGDGTHTAKCPVCYHAIGEVQEHSGGTADCKNGKTCEICGGHYGDKISHDFTAKKTTGAYLAAPATTESPRLYYFSCSRCGEKGTETFSHGKPLAGGSTTPVIPNTPSDTEETDTETEPEKESDTEALTEAPVDNSSDNGGNKTVIIIVVSSVVGVAVIAAAIAVPLGIKKKKAGMSSVEDTSDESDKTDN